MAVTSTNFGLVTGRVSALALDPSDSGGNCLYVGTTGGGVWVAPNAGVSDTSATPVSFTALTDTVGALSGAQDASISIGALTVQPGTVNGCGTTGVILAGAGDPNDALDSYYGAGILRSADGGQSWSLISTTADQLWGFEGEGFAGFAWSTVNAQRLVAAVSQAYEGVLVNADNPQLSYEGLYYSSDSGVTWSLATITDGTGEDVQGPNYNSFVATGGNAATSVVWNPVRDLFVAAVRYHGYYQSTDGITFTRMPAQPGSSLTKQLCPTNLGAIGSTGCPIFRGTLAVNPQTGDTFAWTVDANNQDQGLWQDQCALTSGACANTTIAFGTQWSTAALQTTTSEGAATIVNGDYSLALAAVPSGQETMVLAGAHDLWKSNCPLSQGCIWRNTTNSTTCMSAQVAEYQHTLAWNTANPQEIFVGNDSGLWRSLDAIGETGPVCASTDSSHFQNLNGSLGSLAEVVSLAQSPLTPDTLMAGLGANGTAGVKNTTGTTTDWPQILSGYGGPVVIDQTNSANWYVNSEDGVYISLCSQTSPCTQADFGASPVIDMNVPNGGLAQTDGLTMNTPAPFLVDPLDSTQLLIGTCRVWRGPADGIGWTASNAISSVLDSSSSTGACNGDALIRSMAALALPVSTALPSGGEVIYVGMYGSVDGGAILPGHVLSTTFNPAASTSPVWQDLTSNAVSNDTFTMNYYGLDISSIFIDPHDATGQTIYVTVEGVRNATEKVQVAYRSTNGGANWASLTANLPESPASGLVVDPQDASTAYLATDAGVFFTTQIAACAHASSTCWSAFGTGLPEAPVVQLSASSATSSAQVLVAATYGRGIWQTPLWSAGTSLTTATASPASLIFADQEFATTSSPQTVTLTNAGSVALTPTSITMSGDFAETDDCVNETVAAGGNCTIQVTFTPAATGSLKGQMTIDANVYGGQLTVTLSGTGTAAGAITLTPATIDFGTVELGITSAAQTVEAGNNSGTPISMTSVTITSPFIIAENACAPGTLAVGGPGCPVSVKFAPTQAGFVAGVLTFTDGAGTQSVALSGTGAAAATDILNPLSLTFPNTVVGQNSAALTTTLTNTGGEPLTSITASISAGPFQIQKSNCGTQLTGPGSCSISVLYAPTALGSQTGILIVGDITRSQPQTVALSGTGVALPVITVSPSSLGFSGQQVGVASSPLTLTVTNTGGVSIVVGFGITGEAASSFSCGATICSAGTCGATLAANSSCTVQVIFTPATVGSNTATFTISSTTHGVKPFTVALSGTGQDLSGLNVSPATISFGVIVVGLSSAAQTVTVSNSSSASAGALTFSVPAQFSLTQNNCPSSLAAGASCTVGVLFQPTAVGTATGVLTISAASVAQSATVLLSGTGGVAAAIQVTPASMVFATTAVGATSSQSTVTITNTGATVSLSNLALAVTAGFQLVSNTCATTLAPGLSCTAGVEFVPSSAGAQTGTLTVTSSTVATGVSVPLSGMGFDFTFTVSGSSAQTVASGNTASYALVVTPLNASSGTFAFVCGTLPTDALCVFSPSTETLNDGATGDIALTISTTGTTSTLSPRSMKPTRWRILPLVCGLLLLPLGWMRRQKALLLLALLAILVGTVSSCTKSGGGGGGTGSTGSTGSTATGTYLIPVTAVSIGVSHSVTLTLTVD
jgi:hypothetical protein